MGFWGLYIQILRKVTRWGKLNLLSKHDLRSWSQTDCPRPTASAAGKTASSSAAARACTLAVGSSACRHRSSHWLLTACPHFQSGGGYDLLRAPQEHSRAPRDIPEHPRSIVGIMKLRHGARQCRHRSCNFINCRAGNRSKMMSAPCGFAVSRSYECSA